MARFQPIQGMAFALGVALGAAAYAQTSTAPSDKASPRAQERSTMRSDKNASNQLPRGDRRFIEKLAQHSMAEIELGKLAEKNASSEEVKKFGRQLVEDHTKAQEELEKLAQSKGIDLPGEADRSHRRALGSLEKKTGSDFDRDFVRDMVKDHQSDVKDIQKEARDAKDPEVKALAEKLEPVMEKHLDMARQLDNSVRVSSKGERPRSAATGSSSRPDANTSTPKNEPGSPPGSPSSSR